ncbi:DUF4974 domain-containing protein [Pseudoflavitalea sp. X16]|uniref:FecR family protein n=1 Tax=Paraflavitalea devenefica TaxID=2716334 RepID=UPI00141F1CAA|nr:FecR family protein [Paraflavitalea devenefica]NII27771.1 DUF4974 domain-containing protein [Paraflavitalea devenefica]
MQEAAVNRIIQLILARQKGEISGAGQEELDAWANASEANRQFVDRCLDRVQVAASLELLDKIDAEAAWQRLLDKNVFEYTPVVAIRRKPWRWMVAAITIGVIATGAYLFLNKGDKQVQEDQVVVRQGDDIQPGSNKATLTLGDGRTITLDEAKDGVLAKEDGAAVNKKGDALVYDPAGENGRKAGKNAAVRYHAVTTPTGGFYALTLPDKSKVWLNAESRISYPTVFAGKERRVEVTGEAYFEVAKDPSKPFIVSTGNAEVRVLGTHFNVRNYGDEETIKTTLLEGSVQVSAGGSQPGTPNAKPGTILKPTQQAWLSSQSNKSSSIMVQTVDVESVIAWKNGYFDFKAASFTDVMKEIKRWYAGIESVDIKTPINDQFTAGIPRNVPLSTMLTILQETSKVHFEIKGKTVIVTK